MAHLLWMSVEDSGLVACMEPAAVPVTGPCTLPSSLVYTKKYKPYDTDSMLCPAAILTSFLSYTTDIPPDLWDMLTSPFPTPPTPGAVIANGNFTHFFNCSCSRSGDSLVVQSDSGSVQCAASGSSGNNGRTGLIIGIVIVAIVPWLLVAAAVYICVVHKATLNRLVRRKEAEMARKRSKVPGTPGVALQNGRGVLSLSDVMVTWVVTDVAASTQLWEWKPDVMDRAIDMHNVALRQLMDEFGGHEIRNEGDSFTLSFHDAVDAVNFCLKAQEKLMTVDWPKELVEHQRTATVTVGDVTSNPDAAGKGPPLIAGLRVRMGINTGVPDDIFLHDLTDHVDYRGLEYDLAGEICDLAEGGQILMGPRTLQRWNKVNYSALIDPLTADLLRDQQGGSFLQGGGGNLAHGTSARRGSVTGYGGNLTGGGMMGLARESTQLPMYYGSQVGVPTINGMGPVTGPGGTGPVLSMMPTFRRNSDTHPVVPGVGVGAFARLSDTAVPQDASDEEMASSARPSGQAASTPAGAGATRSLRMYRASSPSKRVPQPRADGHSSDGTGAGAGGTPGTGSGLTGGASGPGGGGAKAQILSPLARNRSKLGSPRAIQHSSMSYNDRTRAAGVRAEELENAGRALGYGFGVRGVRRVNSMEGLARLHAVRAAELAAAAASGGVSARSSMAGRTAGPNGLGKDVALNTGGNATEASDDDRGSPRQPSPSRNASGPLRVSNTRAGSAGVQQEPAGNSGGSRRRVPLSVEEPDDIASAPLPVPAGLQRWLSHGWRGLPGPALPRPQASSGPGIQMSTASPVTAAQGPTSMPTGSAASMSGGPRAGPGGSRVLWSRMNGGIQPSSALLSNNGVGGGGGGGGSGRASAGNAPAPVAPSLVAGGHSNGGSERTDGPSSQPLQQLTPEDEISAAAVQPRTLSRVVSLPASAAGAVAAGLSRLAALSTWQRRAGDGTDVPSRESSLRHHNPLYLRKHSRDGGSRGDSGPGTPVRLDSQQQPQQQPGPASGAGLPPVSGPISAVHTPSASANGAAPDDSPGPGTGGTLMPMPTFGHLPLNRGGPLVVGGAMSAPYPNASPLAPAVTGPPSANTEVSRASRRGPLGPPRMSLTSDAGLGLHPLLLNPMTPGSGGVPIMGHPLLSRLPNSRVSVPNTGLNSRPSPLGLNVALGPDSGTGMVPQSPMAGGGGGGMLDPGPTGDSMTSAGGGGAGAALMRGLTAASTFRRMTYGDHDGNPATGGSAHLASGAGNGDSGGLNQIKGQHGGGGGLGGTPHPQLSYPHNATGGGYYPGDMVEQDGLGSGNAASLGGVLGGRGGGVGAGADMPLLLRLLGAIQALWRELVGAFSAMMRRCLRCVRLLTSSDDDPGDVDMWAHADSTIVGVGGGLGAGTHKSAAAGIKATETKGVLVDMGYYNFMSVDYNGQGPVGHYVHLMQVVPASVAPRVLLFPWPLSLPVGWEKISPGFFDAPGSSRLLFPAMRELMGGDAQSMRPVVTVAFSSIEGFKELSAVNVEAAREVLQLHNAAVRETLSTCNGYECKEFNGSFMTTFAMPTGAVEWALTLQLALVAIPWPEDLLACEQAAIVLHPDTDQVLFRGLRCRVGIYAGPIDRVTPHPKTGRADYFGQPVNRAARLMTAAQGGQVVLDQNLLDEVLDEWRRRQEVRRLATIPSDDGGGGSPPDETGGAMTPSEIRTARSFVSAKSSHRIAKQTSAVGSQSAIASSNPSITNIPELSMQHLSPRGEGSVVSGAAGLIAGVDGAPTSPFGSPHGSILVKPMQGHALRDYNTDGSLSPRGSLQRTLSPAGSGSTAAAAAGALNNGSAGGAGSGSGAGGNGSGGNPGRPLERLLLEQRVQRSARSEPRIQRISRFGLNLPPSMRGGSGVGPAPGPNPGAGGGNHALMSPRDGAGGASVGGDSAGSNSGVNGRVASGHMPVSSPSGAAAGASLSPWGASEGGGNLGSMHSPAGAAGLLRRSPGGRVPTSPRGLLMAATAGHISNAGLSPPIGSPAVHRDGAGPGGPAPSIAHMSWLSQALLTRTSPGGSVHSSVVGPAQAESGSYALAPGLELQPAEWDPAARTGGGAPRARRRQRRASIGAIVENMLVQGRKASITGGHGSSHLGRGAAGERTASGQPSTAGASGTVSITRINPVAALARLIPGSPLSQSGGGAASDRHAGNGEGAAGSGSRAQLHLHISDAPDSPSSNQIVSPRSPTNLMSMLVRRMASSPLGQQPPGTAAHGPNALPPAAIAASGSATGGSASAVGDQTPRRHQRSSHGGNGAHGGSGSGGGAGGSGGRSRGSARGPSWSGAHALPGSRQSHLAAQQPGGSPGLQQHQSESTASRQRHHHHHHHHPRMPPPPPPSPPHADALPAVGASGAAPLSYRPNLPASLMNLDDGGQPQAHSQRVLPLPPAHLQHPLQQHSSTPLLDYPQISAENEPVTGSGGRAEYHTPPRSPKLAQFQHQHQHQQHLPSSAAAAYMQQHHARPGAHARDDLPNIGSPAMSVGATNAGPYAALLMASRSSVGGAPGGEGGGHLSGPCAEAHHDSPSGGQIAKPALGPTSSEPFGDESNSAVLSAAATAAARAAAEVQRSSRTSTASGLRVPSPSGMSQPPGRQGVEGTGSQPDRPPTLLQPPSFDGSANSPLGLLSAGSTRRPMYARNSSSFVSSQFAEGTDVSFAANVQPHRSSDTAATGSGPLQHAAGSGNIAAGPPPAVSAAASARVSTAEYAAAGPTDAQTAAALDAAAAGAAALDAVVGAARASQPGGMRHCRTDGGAPQAVDGPTSANASDDLTIGNSSLASRLNVPTPMLNRGGYGRAAAGEADSFVMHGNPMFGTRTPGTTMHGGGATTDGGEAGYAVPQAPSQSRWRGSSTGEPEDPGPQSLDMYATATAAAQARAVAQRTSPARSTSQTGYVRPPPSPPLKASPQHSQQLPQIGPGSGPDGPGSSNALLRLGLPPAHPNIMSPPQHMVLAGLARRRSSDGPPPAPSYHYPGSQAQLAAAAAASGGSGSAWAGAHASGGSGVASAGLGSSQRRFSRNSSGGMQYASPVGAPPIPIGNGMESPAASDAYGFTYGRSTTHDDMQSPTMHAAGGLGSAAPPARKDTQGSKTTLSGSLYGSAGGRATSAFMSSMDAGALASAGGGVLTERTSGGNGPMILAGGIHVGHVASGAGTASGGAPFLAVDSPARTSMGLSGAGSQAPSALQRSATAAIPAAPMSATSASAAHGADHSARRRASSGTSGVSLRAAAEAAITQMQLMSGATGAAPHTHGHGHGSLHGAAGPGGLGSAGGHTLAGGLNTNSTAGGNASQGLGQSHSGSSQQALTPSRVLRKSTSSRGRHGRVGGTSYDPALVNHGGAPSAGPILGAGAASAGMGGPVAVAGPAGHSGSLATPRPLRTVSARRARGAYEIAAASGAAGGGFVLPQAVEQLAAFVSAHGGLDLRASPPLDRIGAGAVTPRSNAQTPGGMPPAGGSLGPPGVLQRGDPNLLSLRRSAPGHPLAAAMAAAAAAASSLAVISGAPSAGQGSQGYAPTRAFTSTHGAVPTPPLARSPSLYQAGLSPAASTAYESGVPVLPTALSLHGPASAAPDGALRASSNSSHPVTNVGGSGGVGSPATTTYSRHATAEHITTPPSGADRPERTSNVPPSASRRNVASALAAAAAAAVAAQPGAAGGYGAPGVGLRGVRSSMPTLPSLATAAASIGSDTTMAGMAGGGGTISSNADRVPNMAAHTARLRASHQSLPEDVLSQAGASISREVPRPSDAARSRWRSPRTPPNGAADGDASGSMSAAIAPGMSLEKLSHPGGPTMDGGIAVASASVAASTTANTMPGMSGGTAAGASQAGGGAAAAGGGAGAAGASGVPKADKDKDKDKESRPAVMAECYKITQQPAGGMGGTGNEVAQSITMIKYTNLKQELERAEEGEGDDVPVPTNMLLVPTVAVDVAIWSLGSFRLKGVTEPIKIVQVLPVSLEGRLSILNKAGLNRGKARCIERRVACLEVLTLQLPDVSRLSCVSMAGGSGTPGGEDDMGPSGAYAGEGGQDGGYDGGYGHMDMLGGTDDAFATHATIGMGMGIGTDQLVSTAPGCLQWQPADLIAADSAPGVGGVGGQHAAAHAAGPHAYPPAVVQQSMYSGPGGAGGGNSLGGGVGGGGSSSMSLSLMQRPPIILGAPTDSAGRWMPSGMVGGPGMRGNNPLREIDISEAGLPPISEVVTPVSSPIGRRSRSDALSQPGGSLALQHVSSIGAGASTLLGPTGSGIMASTSGADGFPSAGSGGSGLGKRRGVFPPPPVAIPDSPISPPQGNAGIGVLALPAPPPPPPTLVQQQQQQPQQRELPLPPHGISLQRAATAGGGVSASMPNGPPGAGFVTMASTGSFEPDTSRPESISLSYAAQRQQALAATASAAGTGSYTLSPAGTGLHRHMPSGGLGSAALSGGSDSGGEALRNYQQRQAGRNAAGGYVGRGSPHGPAAGSGMWPQSSSRHLQQPPRLHTSGDGTSPSGGAVAHSTMQSTGLLPTSLSYMATSNYASQTGGDRGIIVGGGGNHTASGESRDPIGRGYAAMLAAGMDVHSVGGESPADSLRSHRGSAQGGGSHPSLLQTGGSSCSGAQGGLPPLHEEYQSAGVDAAAADGGGGDGGPGNYHGVAPAALTAERSSTGNAPSSAVSPLLIDRASSGFYRPYSSGFTPGGPPLMDRSSSGRYPPPSGTVTGTGITPSDRTSSGRYAPGVLPPGISLTTDRSSSGRRNPGSSFGRSEAGGDVPLFSPHGTGLPPLPEVTSPQPEAADYPPDAYPQRHFHRSGSGSSAGGSPGGSDSGRFGRNASQKGGMPSRLGPTRSFKVAAHLRRGSGRRGGGDGEEADGEGEEGVDQLEQQRDSRDRRWLEDEHAGCDPLGPPGDPSDYHQQLYRQQQQQQQQQQAHQQLQMQLQLQGQGHALGVNSVDSGSGALGGYPGSGYGGSGYAGSGTSGMGASDPRRVPTFATLAPQGSHASTDLLDISASVRSSMAGSGALGPRIGRISNAGAAGGIQASMGPVDSLRTFGLRHLPEQQQTSASDLLRPFEEGGAERYASQRG
ncbi:hypothetical protein HYH02_014940 [Chlamydomonas schloesseri]|uniref:Guanylate cyclase domain-containing protein n=1 Tax=Chlamydomonas schloesseri TaxID=2026947 RepID=A0A835VQW3_9CHLO|nr:hypothetical protein HYH02_014940 [Chlamydomonas schloesseri]|eukprot:KAG2425877.1 hypothetical protein HYH02_014940 [Chlamydomonas schloesseri]